MQRVDKGGEAPYLYTKKVMEHFMHPHNMGEIKNPDGIGRAGNLICGDIMKVYIKVEKNKKRGNIIKNIKFKTLGCAAAIATSSMITELAKNKTIDEAIKINRKDVADSLGGLPPIKIHCSALATDALNEAIYDYLSKKKLPIPESISKKHEKIKNELVITEKRYKKFVKAQEQFLK
jgi:nitrogen fixation NifU-like protein